MQHASNVSENGPEKLEFDQPDHPRHPAVTDRRTSGGQEVPMGNWASSSNNKDTDDGGTNGNGNGNVDADVEGSGSGSGSGSVAERWVERRVAKAMANPGRKMMGSGADFTPKWVLVVTAPSFTLKCTSGYDFRGRMSSSGQYDGKVALREFSATGTVTGTSADPYGRFSVEQACTKETQGETKVSFLLEMDGEAQAEDDGVREEFSDETCGYDITGTIDGEGGLTLEAEELNDGQAITLVRV